MMPGGAVAWAARPGTPWRLPVRAFTRRAGLL